MQNFPNPFNGATNIRFVIQEPGLYSLRIYNSTGMAVFEQNESFLSTGYFQFTWQGKNQYDQDLPSGVYFVELNSRQNRQFKKMLLLR